MNYLVLLALTGFSFQAQAELSAFEQSLQNESPIETRESVEAINGVKYRKVESEMGIFYLKLLGRNEEISELDCNTKFNTESPHMTTVAVRVFRRSRIFVRHLKESCESKKGSQQFAYDWSKPALQVGIQIPDSKDSTIKDKEIHTNPFLKNPNAGFSGSF